MKLGIIVISILVVIGLIIGLTYLNLYNTEIALRTQIEAQQKVCETFFDKTWKIIKQQADVADKYKEAFREIYPELIAGRYEGKNPLFEFIRESNPDFSTKLYEKLSDSIEIQRTEFTREQQKLIDIKREHDSLRLKFPGYIFLSNIQEIKITVITSTKTEEVFKTGKEDNIDL